MLTGVCATAVPRRSAGYDTLDVPCELERLDGRCIEMPIVHRMRAIERSGLDAVLSDRWGRPSTP